ncbi:MAG: AraC family transcriptional regulator [Niastella sp.]|nr:AraC family transcriptional regulator [Niastella sp.]
MEHMGSFLHRFKQNDKLTIRIASPDFGHPSADVINEYGLTHRAAFYCFFFMVEGSTSYQVDLRPFEIVNNDLLFVLPHQMFEAPATKHDSDYFKIVFDDDCLSLLPKQYPFLIDPLNNQKIRFAASAAARSRSIFELLVGLLSTMDTDPELILAHLNSLLTEINTAYFASDKNPADSKLSKYIAFKVFVEKNLTEHLVVSDIAEELGINTNGLYQIVKHYSGASPKEFIINRLILEARRRLHYRETSSIKELAFDLGFNDPEYFSRLFKKVTGKPVSTFLQDLSGN